MAQERSAAPAPLPLAARLGYTVWMLVWVAVILSEQGPQNFVWLCNVAKFLILYSVWTGDRLLLSSQAGTFVLVGAVWTVDLLLALPRGASFTGFTDYMFNPDLALAARLASLYHLFMPLFVIWALTRTGYDRRGWWLQCVIGACAVVAAWLVTEPHRNVNWVHRPFGLEQPPLAEPLWVALLVVALPLLIYLPGHWLVQRALRVLRGVRAR